MGAGFASFQLERNGSDRQTFPHPGTFLYPGDPARESAQDFAPHVRDGDRGRASDESKKHPRLVPITQGDGETRRFTAGLARALDRLRGNVSAVPPRARAVSEESGAIFAHG